nr:probable UDP-N-acetylglucosamine--peptide N-acetylglucosaminyltransferase SPINDLY [Tanacetum cinerariifolium]
MWRDIYGLKVKKVASIVRDDKVDILVELTSHTTNNKMGWLAILHLFSYCFTGWHVEELVRLPDCFLCYTLSPEAGFASPTPALSNGFITCGSFKNLAKITPKVLQVWAKILCVVSKSRLIVKCKPFCCDNVRQRFLSTLEQLGLESLRVNLLPLILLNHEHMQAYSLMDISLDTFPYAGTTTTCESFYMGVPCVTMGDSVHAHNVGVSLLSAVGLEHLVAKTENEYIRLAIHLAFDVTSPSNLRVDLQNLLSNSPLCNGSKFINGLEFAYRDMWRGYCKGQLGSLNAPFNVLGFRPGRPAGEVAGTGRYPVVVVTRQSRADPATCPPSAPRFLPPQNH